ncbi:MAG TPA: bacitracin ABC transporter ATP-binding protein, partial [Clostridiales bacterium]|nr:bacitracin ABC transporter ATP-binding protein [Clostridiales bacterium]
MNVFETSHLTKTYGKNKVVLDDVSLTVREGDIYGLVGRNGAGKTTLIRILLGLASPTSGEVRINGASSADALAYERRKIGSIVDSPALSTHLTALENMKSMGYSLGITNEEKLKDILHKVGLDPNNPAKVKNYSLGMKQRLAIA